MPHIVINMYPGRSEELKKEIAEKTKNAFIKDMGFPAESLSVSIIDIERDVFAKTIQEKYDRKYLYISNENIK